MSPRECYCARLRKVFLTLGGPNPHQLSFHF
jgi:hypothetical protein